MNILAVAARVEYLDDTWKYFCNESYVQAIQQFHWTPLIVPTTYHAKDIASIADALLLPGGYDIASCYLQQPLHEKAHLYEHPMDHFDFTLVDAFVKARKPILGICRGMQILNVYFNGGLHQHIDVTTHEESPHAHIVIPEKNTVFEHLLQVQQPVNSYHHQAVSILGEDLLVGARSKDGTIEAFSHKDLPIIAVQWHPEKMHTDMILPYFFDVL